MRVERRRHRYAIYGARIDSDVPIFGALPRVSGVCDIAIQFLERDIGEPEPNARLIYSSPFASMWRGSASYHFTYEDGTKFLVSSRGDEIAASTPETLTLEDTCTYLFGPVLRLGL